MRTSGCSVDVEQTKGSLALQTAACLRTFLAVSPLAFLAALSSRFNIKSVDTSAIGIVSTEIAHKLEIWWANIASYLNSTDITVNVKMTCSAVSVVGKR